MKILLANTAAFPTIGGVENSLRYIGRDLCRQGHEVKILCLQAKPADPLRSQDGDMEIVRIPYTPARWPHQRLRRIVDTVQGAIPELLREFCPDAVWCRSVPMAAGIRRGGYSGPLLQIYSTNARMHCRGIYLTTRGLPWKRRAMLLALWPLEYFPSRKLEREVARTCTSVTFSENMRSQLLADLPASCQVCQVLPPGVDGDVYSPESGARHFKELSERYGLKPEDPSILYVGRLSTAKHLPMLMDAMAEVGGTSKLVLVGSGTEEKSLQAYGDRCGLRDRLVFAGSHHDLLPGFYVVCRASVLPTTIESFGQVYLESLACGTPAIGFAGDGKHVLTATDEVVRHRETGYVVKRVGPSGLAEGIRYVLSLDAESRTAMSRRARSDALDRYSWRRFVDGAIAITQGGEPEGST